MYQVDNVIKQSETRGIWSQNFQLSFKGVCRVFSSFLPVLHYPNSPKNGKPALSPHHDWLRRDPSGKMRLYVFGFTRNNGDNQTKGSARCDLLSWKDPGFRSEYLYP